MSNNPDELRRRLSDDIRQAMAAAHPTADERAKRRDRGPAIQGIKAKELSFRLGVDYDTILDWLKGARDPARIDRENRLKLCEFLGITEDVFIHRYHFGSAAPPQPEAAPPPNEVLERLEAIESAVEELRRLMSPQDQPGARRGTR